MRFYLCMIILGCLVYFIPLMVLVTYIGNQFELKLGRLGEYSTYASAGGPQRLIDPGTGTYEDKSVYVPTPTAQVQPPDLYVEWNKSLAIFEKHYGVYDSRFWRINQ